MHSPAISFEQLRQRMGKLCVSLSGPDMLLRAAELLPTTPFVEFRLDSLPDPQSHFPQITELLRAHPEAVAVATCRRTVNGGAFQGSGLEEIATLGAAAAAGCHIVDLSLETAEERAGTSVLQQLGQAHLLLSWHDFEETPSLAAVYARMRPFHPAFFKIVPTAQTLSDNIAIFDLLQSHSAEGNLIALAMGQPGLPSRVLGPRFGSAFTFAAPSPAEATAPGQVDLRTLTDLYRIDTISPSTRIFGVAGKPISSSMSPLMHNTAFRQAAVDAVYLPLETDSIDDLLRFFGRVPLSGGSITMPLKQQVLPHLDEADPLALQAGAVNTLVQRSYGLYGCNTDIAGILGPLGRHLNLADSTALVLGAGGAARAAVFGLRSTGAHVFILSRNTQAAEHLAREADAHVQARATLAHTRFDLILNATSFGMQNNLAAPPITPAEMNCDLFFDLVYNPIETPLIRVARQRSIPVLLGIDMFVEQGARQFELFTGQPAPKDEMRLTVLSALQS